MAAQPPSDPYNVIPTITQVAEQQGVPPALAIATAQQESGLNPYAVGDHGTSFGLYQLHQGGELPQGWTQQQAEDPQANAQVALSHMAQVYQANPDADPGSIAAQAQGRPTSRPMPRASIHTFRATNSFMAAVGSPRRVLGGKPVIRGAPARRPRAFRSVMSSRHGDRRGRRGTGGPTRATRR